MVLTARDFEQASEKAKTDITLKRLFDLRKTTKVYIIQCLADREIEILVQRSGDQRSAAYRHNSKVIHSPHTYATAKAVEGLGWDNFKPLPPRLLMRCDAENQQTSRIRELERLVAGKEQNINSLKASNKRLQSDLKKACQRNDSLRNEMNELYFFIQNNEKRDTNDSIYRDILHFERKSCSYKSPETHFRKLLILVGLSIIIYKNPEKTLLILKNLCRLTKSISFYSLLSVKKILAGSIYLLDIPLNLLEKNVIKFEVSMESFLGKVRIPVK